MLGLVTVCKFGGTSLADTQGFLRVRSIVESNPERRYIVVSAPGKLGEQEKVTELLACCHKSVVGGRTNNFELLFAEISGRFMEIARGLSIGGIEIILETIRVQTLQGASLEWVMSRGEYVNALLFARLMEWPFVDAADVVRFDAAGILDLNETRTLLRSHLEQHEYAVIPGFYGSDLGGATHLFPRGGSDITGSLVAVAMEAALYENWTDVSGLFLADPHIVQDPRPISQVTYAELRELGYLGAQLFHKDAVAPARNAGIPIAIKNTGDPTSSGTLVIPDDTQTPLDLKHPVTGIAGRKGFTVLTVSKEGFNEEIGSLVRLLKAFIAQGVSVEHVPTELDAASVIFKAPTTLDVPELCNAIKTECAPDRLSLEENLALIAVVGRGMIGRVGMEGRLFQALGKDGVIVHTIDKGASGLSIVVGVSDDDYERAIRSLHDEFR